ncbi:hypothetical protein HMPREF0044_1407 [Gleimia coleocanis DSM 15436]|uniref:DUF4862 domain-containing protein n=1 Tax=Gleimia coleocanis DSM 15436 TaxID=525245 RepID=C0W1W7_9ACTO|nr:DUF4862 family protein [Gleimia coleocanis]EEH63483.1 hypothetical protein HMPREF0044_1407 [Gleimia coleocanis DSM 15436]
MSTPFLVGAYAALPAEKAEQVDFYTALAETGWINGIEIPYPGIFATDFEWLTQQLKGRFPHSVITAIPGTMGRMGVNKSFGLASPENDSRLEGLQFVNDILTTIDQMHQYAGERIVTGVEIHSAPGVEADKEAFKRSLDTLSNSFDAAGLDLIIEHCDAYNPAVPGEKRFLTVTDEIWAARDTLARLTLNWGRSVVETHDAKVPAKHLQEILDADLLAGVMFSGAGAEATQYGPVWADAHLPLVTDEPTSWMTPELVRECMDMARGHETYKGIKIQTPKTASIEERLQFLTNIKEAMGY